MVERTLSKFVCSPPEKVEVAALSLAFRVATVVDPRVATRFAAEIDPADKVSPLEDDIPPFASSPPLKVEEAVPGMFKVVIVEDPSRAVMLEASKDPSVMVKPLLVTSPPPATDNPPLVKVEVAELVFKIDPPLIVKPDAPVTLNPSASNPPSKDEVAVPSPTLSTPLKVVDPVFARVICEVVEVLASFRVPRMKSPAVVEANQCLRLAPAEGSEKTK